MKRFSALLGAVHAGGVDEDDLTPAGSLYTPAIRLRVVCGLGVTMASFSPTMRFSSVDLPTLGRPKIATVPATVPAAVLVLDACWAFGFRARCRVEHALLGGHAGFCIVEMSAIREAAAPRLV